MKTLAEYLAEYIDQEAIVSWTAQCSALDIGDIQGIVEQGIEAYESTENCRIIVGREDCQSCRKCGMPTCGNDTEHYSCFEQCS